ncbi:MAG: aminopeptidase P family protein, partial [Methanothrix sp.]
MEYILHPRSEIDERIKRLQSQMNGKSGMDGAILFHSVDVCYFC